MAVGGYQQPEKPAVISGPGALSARTDGSPTQPATYIPGMPWGQGGQTYANQTQASMAGTPFQADVAVQPETVSRTPIRLDAPTMKPDEPGTAGIDRGDGIGSIAMMDLPKPQATFKDTLNTLRMFDDSGEAEIIWAKVNGVM
jgi:hypothetical protein